MTSLETSSQEIEALETRDWLDSLDDVLRRSGPRRVERLLVALQIHAQRGGATLPVTARTPYVNTIPRSEQPLYPGDLEIERRIKSIIRWNAMAMVVRANRAHPGIGGHISTYASAATLLEVGFNHFFRGPDHESGGDIVYFQGHASPGVYARAFVEGRLTEEHLMNFRLELRPTEGLASYPHPWLMPDFWQAPTVSMGLSPIMAIYQARFIRYLENRGIREARKTRVWAMIGDGECDEPESLGALTLASRESLDNLIFVVNCNLQRLDGPVRGNGKIIQELEATFHGAGWNVIKVLWGGEWDALFERDPEGVLARRLGEVLDGEYQMAGVRGGSYIRQHIFGVDPRLRALVEHLTDEQLWRLRNGGHDPVKVHAAYQRAVEGAEGAPTVILARTIKGYGLGEAGEGRNVTHQQKKLNERELLKFRDRFGVPISDEDVANVPFYRPKEGSLELEYVRERIAKLGGPVPRRVFPSVTIEPPESVVYEELYRGSERPVSTTMAFVRLLAKLLRDTNVGAIIVPIVPDEARTFGMDSLFRQVGIYSSVGQLYEPVNHETLLRYREAKNGQILEEGITEAGSMSSFIAAGTAYASLSRPMIPFFIYYSMFGFQRFGDLIWAGADMRCRGFLVGGTAGRTTLMGEGLQHQDGHSHVLMQVVPNLRAYDPAFAYEIGVIVEDGIRRIAQRGEDVLFYLTVTNEPYPQPPMPSGAREGIVRGMYCFRAGDRSKRRPATHANLLGSGAILKEVLKAQEILDASYGVSSDVWSVTSYVELRRDALDVERSNLLRPMKRKETSYLRRCFGDEGALFVATSDYMKALPDSIAKWLPGRLVTLGTDGFGRSDTRERLRDFFEIDAHHIVFATLSGLYARGAFDLGALEKAAGDLQIDSERPNPMRA